MLVLLLLLLPAGARDGEGMRVVPAQEILDKIERGEIVEYDHVIVEGDLDLESAGCLLLHPFLPGHKRHGG